MMTERDWFAAFAMHALLGKAVRMAEADSENHWGDHSPLELAERQLGGSATSASHETIAREAQDIAAAMMNERKDRPNESGAINISIEGLDEIIVGALGGVSSEIEDASRASRGAERRD
jgi:hypothetical protein